MTTSPAFSFDGSTRKQFESDVEKATAPVGRWTVGVSLMKQKREKEK